MYRAEQPPPLLRRDDEVAAPVLLPARLAFLRAERLLLALADQRHPVRRHTEIRQVIADRRGAAVAERQVVLRAAARIAVPFERDLRAGPPFQEIGVLL